MERSKKIVISIGGDVVSMVDMGNGSSKWPFFCCFYVNFDVNHNFFPPLLLLMSFPSLLPQLLGCFYTTCWEFYVLYSPTCTLKIIFNVTLSQFLFFFCSIY